MLRPCVYPGWPRGRGAPAARRASTKSARVQMGGSTWRRRPRAPRATRTAASVCERRPPGSSRSGGGLAGGAPGPGWKLSRHAAGALTLFHPMPGSRRGRSSWTPPTVRLSHQAEGFCPRKLPSFAAGPRRPPGTPSAAVWTHARRPAAGLPREEEHLSCARVPRVASLSTASLTSLSAALAFMQNAWVAGDLRV